jgi:cytochrome c
MKSHPVRRAASALYAALAALLCGMAYAAEPAPAASLPGVTGDAARGRMVFAACRTCHYPEKGFGHHNGPSLHAIFGRRAGTQEGFPYYSPQLKASGIVWSPVVLDAWLANAGTFLPGTTMMFVGIPDPRDRADLIAYLAQFND